MMGELARVTQDRGAATPVCPVSSAVMRPTDHRAAGDAMSAILAGEIRIESTGTVGAYAVGEMGIGVAGDVSFDILPTAVAVVADTFAGGTDGQESAEGLDLLQGRL